MVLPIGALRSAGISLALNVRALLGNLLVFGDFWWILVGPRVQQIGACCFYSFLELKQIQRLVLLRMTKCLHHQRFALMMWAMAFSGYMNGRLGCRCKTTSTGNWNCPYYLFITCLFLVCLAVSRA